MSIESEPAGYGDEGRRRYNREYMRRWRANPANLARERANRKEWHYLRKLRSAMAPLPEGRLLCAFCHRRASVRRVSRLEVVQGIPGGFVEVKVPYCGEC